MENDHQLQSLMSNMPLALRSRKEFDELFRHQRYYLREPITESLKDYHFIASNVINVYKPKPGDNLGERVKWTIIIDQIKLVIRHMRQLLSPQKRTDYHWVYASDSIDVLVAKFHNLWRCLEVHKQDISNDDERWLTLCYRLSSVSQSYSNLHDCTAWWNPIQNELAINIP